MFLRGRDKALVFYLLGQFLDGLEIPLWPFGPLYIIERSMVVVQSNLYFQNYQLQAPE